MSDSRDRAGSREPVGEPTPADVASRVVSHVALPLDGLSDAVAVLDRAWRYVYVNGEGRRALGPRPRVAAGRQSAPGAAADRDRASA